MLGAIVSMRAMRRFYFVLTLLLIMVFVLIVFKWQNIIRVLASKSSAQQTGIIQQQLSNMLTNNGQVANNNDNFDKQSKPSFVSLIDSLSWQQFTSASPSSSSNTNSNEFYLSTADHAFQPETLPSKNDKEINSEPLAFVNNSWQTNIDYSSTSPKLVKIVFQIETDENLPGFDEPAAQIHIDDKLVWQIWAADIVAHERQTLYVPIPNSVANDISTLPIKFSILNTGDGTMSTTMQIFAIQQLAEVAHELSGTAIPGQINSMQIVDEGDGEYYLQFLSPQREEFLAGEYEVVFSSQALELGSWPAAQQLISVSHKETLPRLAGKQEQVIATGLIPNHHYYVYVRFGDALGRLSLLSAPHEVNKPQPQLHLRWLLDKDLQVVVQNMPADSWVAVEIYYKRKIEADVIIDEKIIDEIGTATNGLSIKQYWLGSCSETNESVSCVSHQVVGDVLVNVTTETGLIYTNSISALVSYD